MTGPLAGTRVSVGGTDPAIAHAAWLLGRLGATIVEDDRAADRLAALGHEVTADGRSDRVGDWAASGAAWLTGLADGPPLIPPGIGATAARGALLVFELLSSIAGQRVAVPGHLLLGEHAAALGLARQGPWSAGGAFRLMPAADGLIGISLARPSDVEVIPALVQHAVGSDQWRAVLAWAATQPADTAVAWAQELGTPAARVPDKAPTPANDAFLRCSVAKTTTEQRKNAGQRPLLVDLSALWAGPLCAHLLGLAGARVIKVESWSRPDGARGGRAPFYDLLHGGHECVALDFADRDGRRQLRSLIEAADVVIDSSRPRAMAQLGIEPAEVVSGGDHRTWVSITAYGRAGPWANRVGFGDDVAVAAGLVATDPATGTAVPCGDAIADPLTGVHAAVAALASVVGGGSRVIDIAMRDVVAMTLDGSKTEEAVDARKPQIRDSPEIAAPLGADTKAVLAEFGVR